MANLVKAHVGEAEVLFEVDDVLAAGPQEVSRGGHVIAELEGRLDNALDAVRPAAGSIVNAFADLDAQELKLEFGLKLDAAVGAIIAKTGVSGHFTVTLTLKR